VAKMIKAVTKFEVTVKGEVRKEMFQDVDQLATFANYIANMVQKDADLHGAEVKVTARNISEVRDLGEDDEDDE
jgi:hypothetical protein